VEADSGNGYAPGWGMLLMMMMIFYRDNWRFLGVKKRTAIIPLHEFPSKR